MPTVSWSWLINNYLISNFYGDGLNYVSTETDFLSDHMICSNAQKTKQNFSASAPGSGAPEGRQMRRPETNKAKQQHAAQSD